MRGLAVGRVSRCLRDQSGQSGMRETGSNSMVRTEKGIKRKNKILNHT